VAPSGVDELPYALQQATVLAGFAGLGAATLASASAYEAVRRASDESVWWQRWETFAAATLGVTFVLAGRSHFTMPEAFKAIYPPPGTWGFWYLPGSSDFHVAWTGVAELLGGAGLLLGCLLSVVGQASMGRELRVWVARAVFLLVLAVSPANMYMFTHGAVMPGVTPDELPLGWHAGRFVAQALVLSVLLTTAQVRLRHTVVLTVTVTPTRSRSPTQTLTLTLTLSNVCQTESALGLTLTLTLTRVT